MNLDGTDVRILKVLQENGRLSFRQIAERVGVSVPTVSSKIANMENTGVIRGYTALLDPEKLGEICVIITIKAKPSELRPLGERLKQSEHVRQVYLTSNSRVLLLCSFTESHMVNDFVNHLSEQSEIIEYDVASIIGVMREDQRALVTPGLTVVLQCIYCKKEIRDEAVKMKLDGKDYYLCCQTCQKAFQEKYEKLKSLA
jgi:DNA-binding Lrp family transcriptional regulator